MTVRREFLSIKKAVRIILVSLLTVNYSLLTAPKARAVLDPDNPVQGGLNVNEMSVVFADIYKKLDSVKWDGKNIRVAIEAIQNAVPNVQIADTDTRVIVVHGTDMIGNWPRPDDGDWKGFGRVTTAIVLALRDISPELARLDEPGLYRVVVGSIMGGINESGRYVFSRAEARQNDPHVLTSLGIGGTRTWNGDYALNTIFKGSPAEAAGLVEGDILISANGTPLRNLSDPELQGLFNGFSSGTIKMEAVGRDKRPKNVTLRRASVVIADADIVTRNVPDGIILEIIIHRITDNSVEIVSDAIMASRDELVGIYLDLRGATGEDELAMAKMAGLFLGQVPVARITAEAMEEIEIIPGGDAIIDVPVVVAVSNTTSGTPEGLAFAFWENNRGAIIGVPTAGKSRLPTRLSLNNGGALELMNRTMRSGQDRAIHGRGFFPPICLSNIRTSAQKDVFLINVRNRDWNPRDFNADESVNPADIRRGCPNIKSGADEDAAAAAVAIDILLAPEVYAGLCRRAR